MPFFGFIATHFATSPPNSLSSTLAPLPHPSCHCLSSVWVRPALTHKPKHLPPWTTPHSSTLGHSHPHIQIGNETSEKNLSLKPSIWAYKSQRCLVICPSWSCICWGQRYSSQRDSVTIMVKTHELTGGGPCRDSCFCPLVAGADGLETLNSKALFLHC